MIRSQIDSMTSTRVVDERLCLVSSRIRGSACRSEILNNCLERYYQSWKLTFEESLSLAKTDSYVEGVREHQDSRSDFIK